MYRGVHCMRGGFTKNSAFFTETYLFQGGRILIRRQNSEPQLERKGGFLGYFLLARRRGGGAARCSGVGFTPSATHPPAHPPTDSLAPMDAPQSPVRMYPSDVDEPSRVHSQVTMWSQILPSYFPPPFPPRDTTPETYTLGITVRFGATSPPSRCSSVGSAVFFPSPHNAFYAAESLTVGQAPQRKYSTSHTMFSFCLNIQDKLFDTYCFFPTSRCSHKGGLS